MSAPDQVFGIFLVVVGVGLIVAEFVHPGVFLLIPATIAIVAGLMYFAVPDFLLGSIFGPGIVLLAAVASILVSLPYYQKLGRPAPPHTTIPMSLVGQTGLVLASVEPNSLRGKVRIQSEIWSARSKSTIPAGSTVQVISGEGVSVEVVLVPEAHAG